MGETHTRRVSDLRKEHGFTGIFVPDYIWEFDNGKLSLTEVHILVEIQSLCKYAKYKKCFVDNKHFADFIGCSERTVERAISHLASLNAIEITLDKMSKGTTRIIKFNEDVVKPEYSEIEYSDDLDILSDQTTFCHDQTTICHRPDDNLSVSSINKKIKEDNNIKAPEPALFSKTSSRRNFRKEHEPLIDTLNSGQIIDAQKKEKRKSSNQKMKDKCYEMIEQTSYDSDTKALLTEYFTFISDYSQAKDNESRLKVVHSSKIWHSKLEALSQLVKKGYSANEVILQSLNNRKYAFYPISSSDRQSYNRHETLDNKLVMNNPDEAREVLARLKADPNRKVY